MFQGFYTFGENSECHLIFPSLVECDLHIVKQYGENTE